MFGCQARRPTRTTLQLRTTHRPSFKIIPNLSFDLHFKGTCANEFEDNFKHCLYIYSSQHLLSLSKSAHQDQSPIATKIIILIGRGFLLACSMFFCLFVFFFSNGILVWSSNFHQKKQILPYFDRTILLMLLEASLFLIRLPLANDDHCCFISFSPTCVGTVFYKQKFIQGFQNALRQFR